MIAHASTVHPRQDVRILFKEAATLAASFGEVTVFVQDGKGDAPGPQGVTIRDTGRPARNRFARIITGSARMARALRRARPDLIHIHDPELIPAGLVLKLLGHRVIYDAHEDLPRQILAKHYLPKILRRPLAILARVLEGLAARCFDGIVAATPTIAARFPASRTALVRNYPLLAEFPSFRPRKEDGHPVVAYVGGISPVRGSTAMVCAMEHVTCGARLDLAGPVTPATHLSELAATAGWRHCRYAGTLDRAGVATLLGSAHLGLVLLSPKPAYREALPVKMFEYMAAGLPVLASDLPLWRQILGQTGAGLTVDPNDPRAIAAAVDHILGTPRLAAEMGRRGRAAVLESFNWEAEARALIALYDQILKPRPQPIAAES